MSELHDAIAMCDVARIEQAVRAGADPNAPGTVTVHSDRERLWCPLVLAAHSNARVDVVRAVLDAGADIHRFGGNALAYAVAQANDPAVVRVLLERGADARTQVHHGPGLTPILHCVCTNTTKAAPVIAQLLIDAGCDPNERDHGGASALTRALFGRSLSVAQVLLGAGADPTAITKEVLRQAEVYYEVDPAPFLKLLKRTRKR